MATAGLVKKTSMVTVKLVKKTSLEETIEKKDIAAITALIARKEAALEEARENAAFYAMLQDGEKADIEAARARLLARQIEKLRAAI